MTKKLITGALVAILGVSTFASISYADGKRCGRGGDHGQYSEHMVERMSKHLELSSNQTQQLKEIFANSQKVDSREQMKDMRKAMMALDPTSPGYDAEVDKLAKQAADTAALKVRLTAEQQQQIAAILTDEQREKAQEMKQRMMEKRGHRG